MREQLKKNFPGDEENYINYLNKEKIKFDKVYKCLNIPYHKVYHYLRPRLIRALPSLNLSQSLYGRLKKYFDHEDLRIAMTFQSKYLGMSPWNCPAAFTILSYIEHSQGVYHPEGGLNNISKVMGEIIEEDGGKIHLNSKVENIIVENGQAKGVLLENGEKVFGDDVIINADFAYSMEELLTENDRKKYKNKKLYDMDYSCSTFMIYLGLNKTYNIPHHNIIFSDEYKKNVNEITEEKIISKDPSFYIQNASLIDKTLAPEGKSALYILVPVPNNFSNIDWDTEKSSFRNLIIKKIKEKTELKDIEENIELEKIITPIQWQKEYNVFMGATFNLSHKISQMLYLRPHNKFQDLKNCYLVGGGTHPGSGLPTIYESARISSDLIIKKYIK